MFVSAVTVWELEIKRALGRLDAPADLATAVQEAGFEPLAVTFPHAVQAARLPPNHGDPFDRMLIAQARIEGLLLATSDREVQSYDVPTFAVSRA